MGGCVYFLKQQRYCMKNDIKKRILDPIINYVGQTTQRVVEMPVYNSECEFVNESVNNHVYEHIMEIIEESVGHNVGHNVCEFTYHKNIIC